MSGLTNKQEMFCCEYLRCGNASEAYRVAYDAAGMLPATINRKAKEVMDNGKIAARLSELRKPVFEAAQLTLAAHLAELNRLKMLAEASEQIAVALRSEELRGKASGLYVERVERGDPGAFGESKQDLTARIKERGLKLGVVMPKLKRVA